MAMDDSSLTLLICVQGFEFIYNITLFALILAGLIQIGPVLQEHDPDNHGWLLTLISIGFVIIWLNIVFHNLHLNYWFKLKVDQKSQIYEYLFSNKLPIIDLVDRNSETLMVSEEYLSFIFCFRHTRRVLVDRPSWLLIPKFIIKYGFFIGLYIAFKNVVKANNASLERHHELGWNLDVLFLLFALQPIIFVVLKIAVYPLWYVACCFHKMNDVIYDDEDIFDWSLASFDYIDHYGNYYDQERKDFERRQVLMQA